MKKTYFFSAALLVALAVNAAVEQREVQPVVIMRKRVVAEGKDYYRSFFGNVGYGKRHKKKADAEKDQRQPDFFYAMDANCIDERFEKMRAEFDRKLAKHLGRPNTQKACKNIEEKIEKAKQDVLNDPALAAAQLKKLSKEVDLKRERLSQEIAAQIAKATSELKGEIASLKMEVARLRKSN